MTRLERLDPSEKRVILGAFARAQTGGEETPAWTPELEQALRGEFGVEAEPSDDAQLASAALRLLSEDPKHAAAIDAMAANVARRPESFDFGATVAIVTVALVVLQTRVRIERGADGRWTILADKNAASDELLRSFVAKLLGQASRKPAP